MEDELDRIMQSQSNDFARWQADVKRQLRDGELLKSLPGQHLLQYLEFPSGGTPTALDVFKCGRNDEYCVIETCNNQQIRSPLDKDAFDCLYDALSSAEVPMFLPEHAMGLDGTSYELALGDVGLSWRLQWWQELPHEWNEMKAVVAEMLAYLRKSIKHGKPI